VRSGASARGSSAAGLHDFRSAGRTLFSLGLVKDTEGNLSTFDGEVVAITRTGAVLARLDPEDVVRGSLTADLPDASTDLEFHRELYHRRGPGAIAHAHPPGVGAEGGGPGAHGDYAFAATLAGAVAAIVDRARGAAVDG
jgi:Class II Aldolase and Adducin N-terminal domain